jgi:hypothetical protein
MSRQRVRVTLSCAACSGLFELQPSHVAENQVFCSNACRRSDAAARYRLQKKIRQDEQTGCWNWIGGIDGNGYAVASRGGKSVGGHRLAYELYVGCVPAGKELDHLCRNRRCVNPNHLEAVDRSTNIQRGMMPMAVRRRSRIETGVCTNGHPVAEYWNDKYRFCRACTNAKRQARRAQTGGAR